ncbi:MAG: histidine phosphatase family protein [Hyphomicrobium sp.]|nr:MAG: histidine phosphatase family protein [Hyphomicrobium sp.]
MRAGSKTPVLKPGITLYFVRHGQTDWNRDARYQGQQDIPMNETGRAQARQNGHALRAVMDRIATADFVSSPLARALETMTLIRTELDLPPNDFRIDDQLLELNYGHWEGRLARDIPITDPDGFKQKSQDPYHWRPIGGESYADLQSRIQIWLSSLNRDTVAVSHGGVSRVARGLILNLDTKDVPFLSVPQDKILVLESREVSWL